MRGLLTVACLLWVGCEKADPTPVTSPPPASPGTAEKSLQAQALPAFPSYEFWCGRLGKGVCKGEWEGHLPGTNALGPYRFVVVEYTELRDGEGKARDVFLEQKTSHGFSYFSLGRTRPGRVAMSVMVKELVDRPGAVELRTVFRTQPRFSRSDFHSASFLIDRPSGLTAVEVVLGKILGDNTGQTSGTVGTAEWQAGKVSLKGTALADGEWSITFP